MDTAFPRLRLISGASDFLGAANINYPQKVRRPEQAPLPGRGRGPHRPRRGHRPTTSSTSSSSPTSPLLAVVPEPTSIENGYRFIKSALYRRLRDAAPNAAVREIVDAALDPKNALGIRTPLDLLAAVEREDPAAVAALRREMASFQPRFVVNQVRSPGGRRRRPPARHRLRAPPRACAPATPATCTTTTPCGGRAPAAPVRGEGPGQRARRGRRQHRARAGGGRDAWPWRW